MDSLPFSSSLLGFILSSCHMGYPCISLGQLSWLCPLPRLCILPSTVWGEDVGEAALMLSSTAQQ